VLCTAIIVEAWAAATWLLGFGLWMLVVGDRESKLFLIAPALGALVAAAIGALFIRLSTNRAWQLFGWLACCIAASVAIGWWLIVLVDEGL
jgi:hypothetical protein